MEDELKCPYCRQFLRQPILLPCGHSYCHECALLVQRRFPALAVPAPHQNVPTSCSPLAVPPLLPPSASPAASSSSAPSSSGASDTLSLAPSFEDADPSAAETDKLSVISDSDSGVGGIGCGGIFRGGSSRPSSFLSTSGRPLPPPPPPAPSILSPSIGSVVLVCQACRKPAHFLDEEALRKVPENAAVAKLVARQQQKQREREEQSQPQTPKEEQPVPVPDCQWCEGPARAQPAQFRCNSCGYFYCAECQPVLHPPRGPLKTHQLVPADQFRRAQSSLRDELFSPFASTSTEFPLANCEIHPKESITLYCALCRLPICSQCSREVRHSGHQIQPLQSAAKAHKGELSQSLQLLGAKVRQATEDIASLRQAQTRVDVNCQSLQHKIEQELDQLEALLQLRRQQLLDFTVAERERKKAQLKEQIGRSAAQLSKGRSLIQFCIELLKEPDPMAYLQVGFALAGRVTDQEFLWHREARTNKPPTIDEHFHLDLDLETVRTAIEQLEFVQLRGGGDGRGDESDRGAPLPPQFIAEDCAAENNSITVAWLCPPPNGASIEGFVLELDSGCGDGIFQEVYCGQQCICTIDGLHFNTLYNARVKAFNATGESAYSESICLQTAPVAWFHLVTENAIGGDQPQSRERELLFPSQADVGELLLLSDDSCTVTGASIDYRTVLGSITLAKGVHYWEVRVEEYDGSADIVIGVAQPAVNRRTLLGKDVHGWSMYIDNERSWFFHNDTHHGRMNGGITGRGCIIGVLMDCDHGTLGFVINDRPLCLQAFKNMPRALFCPAFSVNCKSRISIHSGLKVPDALADLSL